jgi:hypothetical protein
MNLLAWFRQPHTGDKETSRRGEAKFLVLGHTVYYFYGTENYWYQARPGRPQVKGILVPW